MRCENCGTELPEDAVFCPECGEHTPTGEAAHSAGEMIDLAHTEGLVRGWEGGQVPEPAEAPEIPDEPPEIPEMPELPEVEGMHIPAGSAASARAPGDTATARARLREKERRAAQALVESAQIELDEELAELADEKSLIEAAGYDVEDVYPQPEEEPPPPPPSAEERMWEETRERAERHSMREFVGDTYAESPEQETDQTEESGQNCCAYGCIALFVVLFLFFVAGFIFNIAQ